MPRTRPTYHPPYTVATRARAFADDRKRAARANFRRWFLARLAPRVCTGCGGTFRVFRFAPEAIVCTRCSEAEVGQ